MLVPHPILTHRENTVCHNEPMVTLPVFSPEETRRAQRLLALKVSQMMGRKLEEGDWSHVYCAAKGIPEQSWSNLNIDVMHEGLGVEHKMLRYSQTDSLIDACGKTFMHPSATRSIRIPDAEADPDEVMHDVFVQYADLIDQRRMRVALSAGIDPSEVDLRTGWLLWQDSLREFLYFEEPMVAPDPTQLRAEWHVRKFRSGGARKSSKSLWVFDKSTGRKRYSVTTAAGIKIQPYFDVPLRTDPNLFFKTVIGERLNGTVRVWLTKRTAQSLTRVTGSLRDEVIEELVSEVAEEVAAEKESPTPTLDPEEVVPIQLSASAYHKLRSSLPGRNDDHCFQLLLDHLLHIN